MEVILLAAFYWEMGGTDLDAKLFHCSTSLRDVYRILRTFIRTYEIKLWPLKNVKCAVLGVILFKFSLVNG